MEYRQHNQPGCGGCLILLTLLILVTGGAPALLNFIGVLFYSGLAGILVLLGLFWAFSYHVQRRVSTYEASQSESHRRFVVLLVNILVKIAQADGHFTKAELRTILNFFQYTLRYKGRLQQVSEFGNIVIKALEDGEVLRLKDIARIDKTDCSEIAEAIADFCSGLDQTASAYWIIIGIFRSQFLITKTANRPAAAAIEAPRGGEAVTRYARN